MDLNMIIQILIVLAVAGVVVYLFNSLIPMDARFKTVINCIIGLLLFIWVVGLFGYGPFHSSGVVIEHRR